MANENLTVPRFYVHTKKNEAQSLREGRPIYDELEVCELRFAANRQTVGVFPAHEVFRTEKNFATGDIEQVTYAMAYPEAYAKFKANVAQDQSGTPLSELPFLTESKRLELKALNIHTAEALAALDGQPLKQLGMGGRELKTQAKTYIDKARGNIDVTNLASRNADLEEQIEEAKRKIADLEAAKTAALPTATYTDPRGFPAGGETPPREGAGESHQDQSPFEDWEDQDIRNWIEANGGETPRKNANHESLVAKADELNKKLADKSAQGGQV